MAPPYLDDLKVFSAVVDAGGFRPAAEKLGMPASTISDIVRRLEDRLGLLLLNRSTRGIIPTDAGRRLIAGLTPAFDMIDNTVRDLQDDDKNPRGPLRLTVAAIAARYVLPSVLPDFLNRYPDINVEISVDNGVVDIIDGGFDAAIRYEENIAADMTAIPIGPTRQRMIAAASPSYLEAHGNPQHPSDLSDHRLIGHRMENGKMVRWEFAAGRRTIRVMPARGLITASIELRVAAALAGAGIIYTFEEVIQPQLQTGALVPVLESWWQAFPGPHLCYYGERRLPAPLSFFITHLTQ